MSRIKIKDMESSLSAVHWGIEWRKNDETLHRFRSFRLGRCADNPSHATGKNSPPENKFSRGDIVTSSHQGEHAMDPKVGPPRASPSKVVAHDASYILIALA